MEDWLLRKRPRPSSPPNTSISSDLTPHLEWTKLTSCHVKKRKPNASSVSANVSSESLQRVKGYAIFFLHDANSDLRNEGENENDLNWFQGRFFPSIALTETSPTSVATSSTYTSKSWGLLGVQKHVQDECLRCEEGGYRELDLTFIRHTNYRVGKKKTLRWKVDRLTWTGGDMMRLSSDYTLSDNQTGVKFESRTLLNGRRAFEMGKKYFPKLVNRLADGDLSDNDEGFEALVVVGTLDVVLPSDFVRRGSETKIQNDNEVRLSCD